MKKIIGRISETYTLSSSLNSNQSELIAIHGRRRVGKTFLVRTIYKKHFVFEFSGIHQEPLKKQLKNFYLELKTKFKSATLPTD